MTARSTTAVLLVLTLISALFGQQEKNTVDTETFSGKRFRFSWSSDAGGAVNGIALLKADGTIEGISSPNESTWELDRAGRLLFKHADGRASTRFDEIRIEGGLLCCEGPFLFRDGITHHLVELHAAGSIRECRITPELAAQLRYSSQRFVYLDPGETYSFRLKSGVVRSLRLVSVQPNRDSVIGLARRADITVEIDGKAIALECAPYTMPTVTRGMRLQADTTSDWLAIPKRVQFSVWDATDPIVDTGLFSFPLPNYRLLSHGMQAYNEPVHLGHRDGDPVGQRFYHNYGVDLAGYEGRQKVVSCIDGVVAQVGHRQGDLAIRDSRGWVFYYGHLDSILDDVKVGTRVERGQWVAMLGKRGASGNFSHLHIGTYSSDGSLIGGDLNRNLNLYPWLVAAYQQETGTNLLAVARPHHTVRTGEKVCFDARKSMAFESKITSYRWEFHDGASVRQPRAERVYAKPGCYIATLWVSDDHGHTDVDFCKVKVYSQSKPEDVIPTLFVTYKPSQDVRTETPLSFRIWPQGSELDNIQVDFGDGTVIHDYRPFDAIAHAFATSGIHIVTVTGTTGGVPVTQKIKVVVGK